MDGHGGTDLASPPHETRRSLLGNFPSYDLKPNQARSRGVGGPVAECSPSPLSPRHSRGRRRPACTPRCRASRTRARIPSTVVISTLVSRLRAAARCQPKPNPKPDPNPNRNPNNPNRDPKQVLALHLHHGARLGAHAAHHLVQRRTWRAEHVRPLPGVRPLHPD